jgi:hypothetical protein
MRPAAALFAVVLVLLQSGHGPAAAQSCTADSQCQTGGLGANATCVGDTLVVRRSACIGGQCRTMEERRENCRSGERQRCIADMFERTTSRCDPLAGRCVTRTDRLSCAKSCHCKDGTLTISTGQCLPNLGCNRVTLRCDLGCACAPEPRCL